MDGEADVDAGIPEEILQLAEAFRSYALRATGVELDYGSDTLPVVDRYLQVATSDLAERQEAEPIVSRAATAYFGEVVRRLIGGFWRYEGGDMMKWEVGSRRVYCAVRPAVVVLEALRQEHVDQPVLRLSPEDAAGMQARLDALPEMSPGDYFLPSTRYDAIDIVFSALRDQAVSDGTADVEFEPDDYWEGPEG